MRRRLRRRSCATGKRGGAGALPRGGCTRRLARCVLRRAAHCRRCPLLAARRMLACPCQAAAAAGGTQRAALAPRPPARRRAHAHAAQAARRGARARAPARRPRRRGRCWRSSTAPRRRPRRSSAAGGARRGAARRVGGGGRGASGRARGPNTPVACGGPPAPPGPAGPPDAAAPGPRPPAPAAAWCCRSPCPRRRARARRASISGCRPAGVAARVGRQRIARGRIRCARPAHPPGAVPASRAAQQAPLNAACRPCVGTESARGDEGRRPGEAGVPLVCGAHGAPTTYPSPSEAPARTPPAALPPLARTPACPPAPQPYAHESACVTVRAPAMILLAGRVRRRAHRGHTHGAAARAPHGPGGRGRGAGALAGPVTKSGRARPRLGQGWGGGLAA